MLVSCYHVSARLGRLRSGQGGTLNGEYRVNTSMFDRLGIQQDDIRNVGVLIVLVTMVMAAIAEGTVLVRLTVGLVLGLVSGTVFLAATAVLNRVKPEL